MKAKNTPASLLLAFFAFICLMLLARVIFTGTYRHVYLLWNIFLGWIPLQLSHHFMQYRQKEKWKQIFLFASWLLFFPNALYLITDLVHLQDNGAAPLWFDVVLLFCCAVLGIAMGLLSLHKTEQWLHFHTGRKMAGRITVLLIFAGSYGVYLGRFGRYNSWDVISNPVSLLTDMICTVKDPVVHLHTWAVTGTFFLLYGLIYFSMGILTRPVEVKSKSSKDAG